MFTLAVFVCICGVMLAIVLPRSSPPLPFDPRTGWSTCNTSDFVPIELQDSILVFTDAHLQAAVSPRRARLGIIFEYPLERGMIVPKVLRLQRFSASINSQSIERHTSSNFCFFTAFCFASMPRRTRLAALFRSAFRTEDSPFPVFVFSASSNTRPSNAFLRWAPVRFSSSGFATPDSSCVWTSLCSNASFCRFDLRSFQSRRENESEADVQVQVGVLTVFGSLRRI
jgi:hypothetical protein